MLKIIIGLMLVFSLGIVSAQEIATSQDIQNAGITPDSPLYPLDLLIERIQESFDENSKLIHAKERLAEMKVMIYQNKIKHAEIARTEFTKLRLRIKDKKQISEHNILMNSLGNKISSVSVSGKLTEVQQVEIKNLISNHQERILSESKEIVEVRIRKRVTCETAIHRNSCCKDSGFDVWNDNLNKCVNLSELGVANG